MGPVRRSQQDLRQLKEHWHSSTAHKMNIYIFLVRHVPEGMCLRLAHRIELMDFGPGKSILEGCLIEERADPALGEVLVEGIPQKHKCCIASQDQSRGHENGVDPDQVPLQTVLRRKILDKCGVKGNGIYVGEPFSPT